MKWLKAALGTFVLLVVIFYAVALILPETYEVQRSIEVERPPLFVYNEVKDYQNWYHWSPWFAMEPTATYNYQGSPGAIGFRMEWIGEKIGEGSLTLENLIEPERIEGRLQFTKPPLPPSKDVWILDETEAGTKVRWINKGQLPYPVGRYLGLMMEQQVGGTMEQGLESLKKYLESLRPVESSPEWTEELKKSNPHRGEP